MFADANVKFGCHKMLYEVVETTLERGFKSYSAHHIFLRLKG